MTNALLGPQDGPPFEVLNEAGQGSCFLCCDHASRAVPKCLDRLGISDESLSRHIGWDIGAAAVTRHLVEALDAPAILAGFSRLVIDVNRDLENPTSMPEVSDHVPVPGNQGLSPEARAQRVDALFHPYHREMDRLMAGFAARGVVPLFLSIHSFTPVMNGFVRPWHIGILWDQDPRLARPLIEDLARDKKLVVGDNEPYSAREPAGFTVRKHAETKGIPHVGIEIRQDLIGDAAGAREWGERLAICFKALDARPELHRIEHF